MILRHTYLRSVALLVALAPLGAKSQSTGKVQMTVRVLDARRGLPLSGVVVELSGLPERLPTATHLTLAFTGLS